MDESAAPLPEPQEPVQPPSPDQVEERIPVPPKWETQQNSSNIWLRSFISLAAYLVIGNYIFPSYRILLLITAILIIHELGHFIAMKMFRYKDLGIFFIPLLGAYVSGSKREVSQTQSAIILLAGPLPGILFGIILFLLFKQNPFQEFAGMSYYTIAISFLFLNLINLIPVYPLDGGQLLNRVFLDEESWVSKGFILLSIAALCWIALFAFSTPSYPLLLFPAIMLLRLFGDKKMTSIEKRIEAEGIHTDLDYADLPDEDYWKIRNILIEEHAGFKDIDPAPPYTYSPKEDRIVQMIKGLLHRHLIQDMPLVGKLVTILIWLAAFALPWFLGIYEVILHRLGY
ncbi:MAG: site-2 protease family protein [Bacteroidetes bacterium]|nr:site-2 protease family protein [Bacteroidota bacterium]